MGSDRPPLRVSAWRCASPGPVDCAEQEDLIIGPRFLLEVGAEDGMAFFGEQRECPQGDSNP
jgi:hypothetical protein